MNTAKIVVARRFQVLLNSRLGLRASDMKTYESHRISVTKRLHKSFMAIRVEPIGSQSRGTSVRDVSDVDLMLVLSVKEARWGSELKLSSTVLNKVRDQLQDRYTTTEVGRDGQAVVVYFADGQYPVDIVPAIYAESKPIKLSKDVVRKYPVFNIPDGKGWWMETSPQAHTRYLTLQNLRSREKLYNVAKLVKFWRSCRSPHIPLSSFHVELLLAKTEMCLGAKSYSQCLYEAFAEISRRGTRALQDPINVSGLVEAANSDDKKSRVQDAVSYSAQHALCALDAEDADDTSEALRQWDIVFNGHFPKASAR